MKNECGPDKQQDVAEAPPQIGGGKRDPFQDELPADSIDPENDHCETEPEKISDRKSVIALGEVRLSIKTAKAASKKTFRRLSRK